MDLIKTVYLLMLLFPLSCELNRLADDDTTEQPLSAIPDDENGDELEILLHEKARILCVETVNNYRSTENKYEYTRWTENEKCADGHAKIDAEKNDSHYGYRLDNCGAWAQCECPGRKASSPEDMIKGCLATMWNEKYNPSGEQGHYNAMSSTKHTMVSCGFYKTAEGKIWAVQNYR